MIEPLRLGSSRLWRASLLILLAAAIGCGQGKTPKPGDVGWDFESGEPAAGTSVPDDGRLAPSQSPTETPADPSPTPTPSAVAQATTPGATPSGTSVAPAPTTGDPVVGQVIENSAKIKLTWIPPGEFTMGSQDTEFGRSDEEIPHRVEITKGFYLGVYEVTQGEFASVMDSVHFHFDHRGEEKKKLEGLELDRFPAEFVSWDDVIEFCQRLNKRPAEVAAGRKYRIPTEAEWEYACRAGTTSATAVGDELDSTKANFAGTHPYNGAAAGPYLARPTTVGSYAPNAWGLYDMHGNVWEWCYDIYNLRFYAESPTVDPTGPKKGTLVVAARVLRGGGWDEEGTEVRSAARSGIAPAHRGKHYGFRLLCTIEK